MISSPLWMGAMDRKDAFNPSKTTVALGLQR